MRGNVAAQISPAQVSIMLFGAKAVNDWGERMLFLRDSKHFVDRPMKNDAKNLVEQFKTMFNVAEWKQFMVSKINETQVDNLSKFIRQNFGTADSALMEHLPEDWVENPQNLKNIKDKNLKQWAIELNKMWKELSKKMPNDMNTKDNQRHSLIYLSDPFFVPGGRFREFRYWDSFWIARGLLASGMEKSVKNMCKNFAELINRFGYVPAGGRIYYSKRSQPPFLTYLVYDYFGATGDIEFLKEIMPALEKELNFWQTKRTVEVKVKGKKMMFYQYRADTKLPRPEAFCHDVKLVKDIADPMEKAKIWHEIASASESGWDFSSKPSFAKPSGFNCCTGATHLPAHVCPFAKPSGSNCCTGATHLPVAAAAQSTETLTVFSTGGAPVARCYCPANRVSFPDTTHVPVAATAQPIEPIPQMPRMRLSEAIVRKAPGFQLQHVCHACSGSCYCTANRAYSANAMHAPKRPRRVPTHAPSRSLRVPTVALRGAGAKRLPLEACERGAERSEATSEYAEQIPTDAAARTSRHASFVSCYCTDNLDCLPHYCLSQ
ncbi:hypothetical protein niasHT_014488 [Heterodera trifolii]|uniref:Trehalase n=1 Tax=Heterodera trifolii TaxID=157864 RepID=A0ABD2L1D5_9BILA